jgi:hypothetical protein
MPSYRFWNLPLSRTCAGGARRRRDDGFGLVESVISLGIAATGLMAVAGLMAASAGMQMRSRETGRSGMAAVQQLERLRILPLTDARVQPSPGGSLTSDQPNYSAVVNLPPAGLVRVRWVVATTTFGALDVRVRAIPLDQKTRPSEVRSLLWRPN